MPRPDFPFPGCWLGVNGKNQAHIGQQGIPNSDLYYLGTTPGSARNNSGVVDHIAFLASEPKSFARRFDAIGLAARKRYLAEAQMFVRDPDGLTIELSFPRAAVEPSWVAGSENYNQMPRVAELGK
jgi:catechol 2,3-dioxygenase-like lactoylglutathione lyase family enzyme